MVWIKDSNQDNNFPETTGNELENTTLKNLQGEEKKVDEYVQSGQLSVLGTPQLAIKESVYNIFISKNKKEYTQEDKDLIKLYIEKIFLNKYSGEVSLGSEMESLSILIVLQVNSLLKSGKTLFDR